MKKLLLLLLLSPFIRAGYAQDQGKIIRGIVLDTNGEPSVSSVISLIADTLPGAEEQSGSPSSNSQRIKLSDLTAGSSSTWTPSSLARSNGLN